MITRILETGREWRARHRTPLKDAVSVRKVIERERARTLRTGAPFSLILKSTPMWLARPHESDRSRLVPAIGPSVLVLKKVV